ncbi:MAG: hypothetical protein OSB34_17375, partial [Planktomarina sp.]|nr:hypothetical protein [Planktomarina sp.]
FRRFVILVSIRSGWIHLRTLSEFAGPLQTVLDCTEEVRPHTVHWTRSLVTHKTQFDCLIDCSIRHGVLKKPRSSTNFNIGL